MLNESISRSVVLPFYEGVLRRRSTYRYYREIAGAPYLEPAVLAAMREDLLSRLVRYAGEHVPFYSELFTQRGLDWHDVRSIDELREHGIFLAKNDLRERSSDLLSREFRPEELSTYATSGSTGDPVIIYMTHDLHDYRDAGKYRVEEWIGKPPGTRSTVIWGRLKHEVWYKRLKTILYWKVRNYQHLSAFNQTDPILLDYLEQIRRHRSKFLESYVSALLELVRVIEKYGAEPPRLEGIITGGEALYDSQRGRIEKAFGCPVYNRYGSTEFKNIASECLERRGMHINIDNIIVEVLDKDGNPIVGEPGDIVVTDLRNLAMPMIRYRIGDIGIMSDEVCPCGRNFPMLAQVIGRENDILRLPDGTTMTSQYFAWAFLYMPGVSRYRAIQKSLSRLVIFIVTDGTMTREQVRDWILDTCDDITARGLEISIEFVDEIPLTTAGKYVFFISELDAKDGGA